MAIFLMVECIILALVNDGLAPELVPGGNYGYYMVHINQEEAPHIFLFFCVQGVFCIYLLAMFSSISWNCCGVDIAHSLNSGATSVIMIFSA